MPPWRYFSPDEVPGVQPALVDLLDEARHALGAPFIVTSGRRDPAQNTQAGGATDSAHLTGEAIDGYFVEIPCVYAALHLLRYDSVRGVGMYPWAAPLNRIIHVDMKSRPGSTKRLWIRNAHGVYTYAPSDDFLDKLSELTWR